MEIDIALASPRCHLKCCRITSIVKGAVSPLSSSRRQATLARGDPSCGATYATSDLIHDVLTSLSPFSKQFLSLANRLCITIGALLARAVKTIGSFLPTDHPLRKVGVTGLLALKKDLLRHIKKHAFWNPQ
ncbi:hypothetical protein E2562_012537 [Oryza meyeriana var. granulata]|uniref:Uncharacterized protein n=1 Tax=Oryza meyeriana var. granulata TaxID=110450 RepID=A0A6G1D2U5_9ORYZ|nr:hypothetical protein E2562_012537 [Oryza meyeriana var. granulata]